MAQTMMAKVIPELVDMKALQEQQQKKQSVIFLEVPANMATEDAPNNSKRYSNNNSKAANKQSDKETNKPKIAIRFFNYLLQLAVLHKAKHA